MQYFDNCRINIVFYKIEKNLYILNTLYVSHAVFGFENVTCQHNTKLTFIYITNFSIYL